MTDTRKSSRWLSFLLIVIMAITSFGGLTAKSANAADSYYFTRTYIHNLKTSSFKINGCYGLCQNAGPHSTGSGYATMKRLSQSSDYTKLAYYYGYKKGWKTGVNGHKLARAFNYVRSGTAYEFSKSTLSSMVSTAKKQNVPDNFYAYFCSPTNKSQSFVAWNSVPNGKIYIIKKSTDSGSTSSSKYTFKGIKFTIYKSDKKTKVATLTAGKNGKTSKESVAPGTYYVKETDVSGSGYKKNTSWHKVTVASSKTKSVTIKNKPNYSELKLVKKLADDAKGGTVKGFNFTITNTKTNKKYKATSDAKGNINIKGLLAGTYRIEEKLTDAQIKEGYIKQTKPQTITLNPGKSNETKWLNSKKVPPVVTEQEQENPDITIRKTTSDGGSVEGFRFKLSGPQSGTYTTDSEGYIYLDNVKPGTYTVTEEMTEAQAARYTQPASQTKECPASSSGNTYVFNFNNTAKEYPVKVTKTSTDGNVQGIEFTLKGKTAFNEDVEIVRQTDANGNIDFGKVNAGEYVVEETGFNSSKYESEIKLDGYENPAQKISIPTDAENGKTYSVSFENIRKVYLIMSKIDGGTNNFLEGALFELKDSKDNSVAVFETAKDEEGRATLKLISAIDGIEALTEEDVDEEFDDRKTIIFGSNDDEDNTTPEDEDSDQNDNSSEKDSDSSDNASDSDTKSETASDTTVSTADIDSGEGDDEDTDDNNGTSDDEQGDGQGEEEEDIPLNQTNRQYGDAETTETDTVDNTIDVVEGDDVEEGVKNTEGIEFEYAILKGLTSGEEYTLTELSAPDSYLPLKDSIKFTFTDMAQLAVVNYHPELGTTAVDTTTGLHMTSAEDKISITDKVAYENLNEEWEYTITGKLMDKATGEPLLDDKGDEITGTTTFTAEKTSGTQDVVFEFAGSTLAGKTTVAFETLYYDGKEITDHAEINDEGQTVNIVDIGTTATDSDTKDHISNADNEIIINDVVKYTNLMVGTEYTIKGVLMDKTSGEAMKDDEGKEITAEKTFTPTAADGEETLDFKFSGEKLTGKTTVVFETLYQKDAEITAHKDLNDEGQTVVIPEIGTKANLSKDAKTVSDVVAYKNLIPGKDYTMKAWLVNSSGKKIKGSEATKKFTAEKADGKITVKLNASKAKPGKAVVFEECYLDKKLVGSHKDLNDKNQTVKISKPESPSKIIRTPSQTGDYIKFGLLIALVATACAGAGTIVHRRRQRG